MPDIMLIAFTMHLTGFPDGPISLLFRREIQRIIKVVTNKESEQSIEFIHTFNLHSNYIQNASIQSRLSK